MKILKYGALALIFVTVIVPVAALAGTYVYGSKVATEPLVSWVSHTEYWNDTGEVSTIVRLVDYKGEAFSIDGCTANILSPNGDYYIKDKPLQTSAVSGNWYRKDPHPKVPGTYEQEVTCRYGNGKTIVTAESFHVSEGLSEIKIVSDKTKEAERNLFNVSLTMLSAVEGSSDTIATNLNMVRSNVTDLIEQLRQNISNQVSSSQDNDALRLRDITLNLTYKIGEETQVVSAQLAGVNATVAELMKLVENRVAKSESQFVQINSSLQEIIGKVTTIMGDSLNQQLLNQQEHEENLLLNQAIQAEMNQKFLDLQNDLEDVKQLCSGPETQNLTLCLKLGSVESTLGLLRQEQGAYYLSLQEESVGVIARLSGDVATKLDSVLKSLSLIEERTMDINQTLTELKDNEEARVHVSIIS